MFALNSADAAALQGIFTSSELVGLSASFSNATGGPDRLFLANQSSVPAPEPASLLLLSTGLAGVALLGRRARLTVTASRRDALDHTAKCADRAA